MLYKKVLNTMFRKDAPQIENYCNDLVLILKPNFFVDVKVTFDQFYHFSIVFCKNAPPLIIDGKSNVVPHNSLLAVNPGQVTECRPETGQLFNNKEYFSIFIAKEFIDGLSYEIWEKDSTTFYNKPVLAGAHFINLLTMFINEYKSKQPGINFVLDSISNQIAIEIIRNLPSNISAINTEKEYGAHKEINKVIDFIHQHSTDKFSLEDLCSIAHLSPYYFIKVFKTHTGKTPHEYYMDIKLRKAEELLQRGQYSITEVAYMSGFSSQSYFSAQFRKKVGCTPAEYQKHLIL